ncbi:MAG: hypothetical protein U0136_02790 [Bdellovibrionota bacterium]
MALRFRYAVLVCAQVALACAVSAVALADSNKEPTLSTPRFTLFFDQGDQRSPEDPLFAKNVADQAINILNDTADEYSRVFGERPTNKVVLRFLSPEEFRRQTGAPSWTSAMFYRGEISIPMVKSRGINVTELHRALRHEYVHAVVAELSDYKCPAWLDEGVAQLLEGQPNPLLGPALRNWIKSNQAMPLDWLQNGFTTLDAQIVPAAYAQSLFAARTIVNTYGFKSIVTYFSKLREGKTETQAFSSSFGVDKRTFEEALNSQIKFWAARPNLNP